MDLLEEDFEKRTGVHIIIDYFIVYHPPIYLLFRRFRTDMEKEYYSIDVILSQVPELMINIG